MLTSYGMQYRRGVLGHYRFCSAWLVKVQASTQKRYL